MDGLFDSYKTTKAKAIKGDFIDKLHSQITVTFLLVIFILIALKQTSDSAIHCWYPKFLSEPQGEYVHQFCWINSTYLYLDESNPQKFADSHKTHVPYYQYMLFIIFAQCFFFYIPSLLWSVIASDATGYIDKLLDIVDKAKLISQGVKNIKIESDNRNTEELDSTISSIDTYVQELIPDETKSSFNNTIKRFLSKDDKILEEEEDTKKVTSTTTYKSNSKLKKILEKSKKVIKKRAISYMKPKDGVQGLAVKYLFLKLLNLSNVLIQLFFMQLIFGKEFLYYGLTYFRNIWHAQNPFMSRQFPYLSLCDYYVHMPSLKVHETTVQCLLSINILVEKFYILIWYWYVMLFIITMANFLSWLYELFLPSKSRFVYKYLAIYKKMHRTENEKSYNVYNVTEYPTDEKKESKSLLKNESLKSTTDYSGFEKDYLSKDVIIMLLLIKSVAGDIVFMELLHILWNDYSEHKLK